MKEMNAWINPYHSDKWKFELSNIPFLERDVGLQMFTKQLRGFTLPDIDIGIMSQQFGSYTEHNYVVSKSTKDLQTVSMLFKANENLANYVAIFKWILRLRGGKYDGSSKQYKIDEIRIPLYDNQRNKIDVFVYRRLAIQNLQKLDIKYGESTQVMFSVTCRFEEIDIEEVEDIK